MVVGERERKDEKGQAGEDVERRPWDGKCQNVRPTILTHHGSHALHSGTHYIIVRVLREVIRNEIKEIDNNRTEQNGTGRDKKKEKNRLDRNSKKSDMMIPGMIINDMKRKYIRARDSTVQYSAVQCIAGCCADKKCNMIQRCSILYSTAVYSTIRYCFLLHSTL